MQVLTLENIGISGICACLPATCVDNLACCTAACRDAARAQGIVKATGIVSRRVLEPGTTALDLCVRAGEALLADTHAARSEIGAVVCVTFTPDSAMPNNACRAQARLGLPQDVIAFDVNLACSGWPYGVYVAGLLARSTGRKVLLLDGDTQTPHVDARDPATVPLFADAGTATLVAPAGAAPSEPLKFAFLADGARGAALQLPHGGTLAMDGFAVFRFVTVDVLHFIRDFLAALNRTAADFDAFVPHQANMFMIEQMARKLAFETAQLRKSGDVLGNSSSASVPVTIAFTQTRGRILASGFGGGLSASVAELTLPASCALRVISADGAQDALNA